MSNTRPSIAPNLRVSHAPPITRDVLLKKRAEYLALCAIAQDSAQIANNLKITAQQQALMADGGAALSKALGNWLVILRTLSLYVEGKAETPQTRVPTHPTDPDNPDQNTESEETNEGGAPVLLRVGLDEVQNTK